MTPDEIIDAELAREGGWRDAKQRPDGSWDPPTNFGITLPVLAAWRRKVATTPISKVTEADLRLLDKETAGEIYEEAYILDPGFSQVNIPFEPLRVQLIDYGINSGPARAVRWLQRCLRRPIISGVMDGATIYALQQLTFRDMIGIEMLALVNDALVAARCEMIREAIAAGKIDKSDELGLLRRAVSFTLTKS